MILAGGRARRMNGADKPMLTLGAKPLIQHVIDRMAPQVDDLLINANGDAPRFAQFGCEIVADRIAGYLGPLAGITAAFEWARLNRPDTEWIISVPCDSPFLPVDLVSHLVAAAEQAKAPVAVATSDHRRHPVIAAWRGDLKLGGNDVLIARGLRKVNDLIDSFPHAGVEFAAGAADPFFNINTPEDLAHAETLLTERVHANA